MGGSEGTAPPDARLRAFVQAQAETLVEHPHVPRLLVREMIDYDAAHAVEQIQHLSVTGFRRLCDLIEEGQRAGIFRADVDPRFAAISTIAQVAYFLVARPAVRILLGQGADGPSPEVVRAFGRHAADFAVAALAAPAVRRRAAARGHPLPLETRMIRRHWLLLCLAAACRHPDDAVRGTGTIEVREVDVSPLVAAARGARAGGRRRVGADGRYPRDADPVHHPGRHRAGGGPRRRRGGVACARRWPAPGRARSSGPTPTFGSPRRRPRAPRATSSGCARSPTAAP